MNALRTKLIAYRLDYHWHFLRKYRKEMLQLYDHKASLPDKRLFLLNKRFNHHCVKATELERQILEAKK